jgi:hypothetical protein
MGTKRIEHVVEDGVEKKHCSKCKTFKPVSEYYKHKDTWDELTCVCKTCNNIEGKVRRRGPDLNEQEDYGRIPHITENGVEKKRCGTCKEHKPLGDFSRYTRSWDGLRPKCNACVKQAYIGRKDKALAQMKVHYEQNKEKRAKYIKEWRAKNPEYYKDKLKRDKEKGGEKFVSKKIKGNIASRIRTELKKDKASKTDSTFKYLGCSIEKLKIHLESFFEHSMSFKNYASRWECDHHLPCASFDMTNPIHQKACFHYKNYRPLWTEDNRRKSCKYDKEEWNLYMKKFVEIYIL